jgi:hypothetical protein
LLEERARAQCSEGLSSLHTFFFYPETGNDPISRITHSRSLSLFSLFNDTNMKKTRTTVLPAATQTRALERHDGYDLFGRDSVGDDRECGWNARHGVEGFSDRVEQETGLLKEEEEETKTSCIIRL